MSIQPLFYLIGASGSGKDSLINYVRTHLPSNSDLLFAHRYITRPADAGSENHIALSQTEFEQRKNAGLFAMNWDSHQLRYGIGCEIQQWIAAGLRVVISGSRDYLPQALADFPQLVPILITVPDELLRERLSKRGRESDEQIEERLSKAKWSFSGQLQTVSNDSTIELAGDKLLKLLSR